MITAYATSKVADLVEKTFCFCVEKVMEAIEVRDGWRFTEAFLQLAKGTSMFQFGQNCLLVSLTLGWVWEAWSWWTCG